MKLRVILDKFAKLNPFSPGLLSSGHFFLGGKTALSEAWSAENSHLSQCRWYHIEYIKYIEYVKKRIYLVQYNTFPGPSGQNRVPFWKDFCRTIYAFYDKKNYVFLNQWNRPKAWLIFDYFLFVIQHLKNIISIAKCISFAKA